MTNCPSKSYPYSQHTVCCLSLIWWTRTELTGFSLITSDAFISNYVKFIFLIIFELILINYFRGILGMCLSLRK